MFVLILFWLHLLFCSDSANARELFTEIDHEIVHLPSILPVEEAITEDGQETQEISIEFSAFGRPISLRLKENDLVSPNFKTYIIDEKNTTLLPYKKKKCYFLHRNLSLIAAISTCNRKSISGFIFLENSTLEINPLPHQFDVQEELDDSHESTTPHVIKRASNPFLNFKDDALYIDRKIHQKYPRGNNAKRSRDNPNLTLEVALFFDEAAYKIFSPYMSFNDEKLRDMLLAYVNAVQALYKHPSIGNPLYIVLVRMDIMKVQPTLLPHYEGERSKLLNSFCEYQDNVNPKNDENEEHWDMGLYVSGLDFFAYENGRRSGVTMGLATVGGVCYGRYACIIAEFGTTNMFGKPYPSAGFTSVYILAHEIGHNLGMRHDSSSNSCSKEGYIMSPSRGTQGETQWSTCSADIMRNLDWATCLKDRGNQMKHLDHSTFMETPGRTYTAQKQCEILLRDRNAYVVPEDDLSVICYSLRCKTPHRSGYYFSGPALEGTECGKGLYCYGGECTKRTPKPIIAKPGGWGPWKLSECKSGCLERSKGYQQRERKCNNPPPSNTDKGCEGPSYQHILCKDSKICKFNKRKTAIEYASEKCGDFAKMLPELDSKGAGLQSPHEYNRLWMGCAIFCRRQEGSYYTPRIELNDLGVDPYFPDGTWCHNENGQDYYCNNHHCLPENFDVSKSWFLDYWIDDFDFPQNALPNGVVPSDLKPFLSLGSNGKPFQTDSDFHVDLPKEEDWETKDYILLPDIHEI